MNHNTFPLSSEISGNPAQLAAIEHINGPAMVLAGPGSGKTFVIIHRIRHLIENAGIDPQTILVITFTKAAAMEMQSRFQKLTDQKYPEVHFGTFHSVFYQIIRLSMSGNRLELITEKEKNNILQHILKNLKDEYLYHNMPQDAELMEGSIDNIRQLLAEISRIKNDGKGPDACEDTHPFKKYFIRIFESYQGMLIELGKIDFDDMILACLHLLQNNPALRKKWQDMFQYILIDEYQDINRIQFAIIQILALPSQNLFIVGDDDQAIYGFRGSKPEIMLHFEDYYPQMKKVFLNINYRCCEAILNVANNIIGENTTRYQKELKAEKRENTGQVKAYAYTTRQMEYAGIVSYFKEHHDCVNQSAVIFRTNAEAAAMAEMFAGSGVPYVLQEKTKSQYEDPVIQDILAYLDFACGGQKRRHFFMIMNKPLRYIKRESAANSENITQDTILQFYRDQPQMQKTVNKLFRDFEMLKHLRPFLAIRYIRFEIGYEDYALKRVNPGERELLRNKMDWLQESARNYIDYHSFMKHISECIEDIQSQTTPACDAVRTGIRLLTMHASKGLEFDTVWLPDLNEGVLPNRRSINPMQIEEERRMLYVGMTRAKQTLMLSYVTGTKDNPMLPSRLIRCIRQLWSVSSES